MEPTGKVETAKPHGACWKGVEFSPQILDLEQEEEEKEESGFEEE